MRTEGLGGRQGGCRIKTENTWSVEGEAERYKMSRFWVQVKSSDEFACKLHFKKLKGLRGVCVCAVTSAG